MFAQSETSWPPASTEKASGSIAISVKHDNQDYGGFLEAFEGARSVEATSNLEADH